MCDEDEGEAWAYHPPEVVKHSQAERNRWASMLIDQAAKGGFLNVPEPEEDDY